jgi:hypothetical protein
MNVDDNDSNDINNDISTNDNIFSRLLGINNSVTNGPILPPISIFSRQRDKTPVPTTTPIPMYSTNISNTEAIISPDKIKSDLDSLKAKFQPLLDEYNKYYNLIYVYNNRNNKDYYFLLNQSQQKIANYLTSLDNYFNTVQSNINSINSKVYVLNEHIQADQQGSIDAKDKLTDVTNNFIGTYEMKDDYNKKYNDTYLSTFMLSIIIVLLGGTLVKIYGRIL